MAKLTPSMRLKVKGDTFFLPDPNGSVYFRNNIGSFRMEGSMIDQWIEKLLPMFNGEYSLEELTDGLPDLYRDRVYEIADSLYQNGFVRDVSNDRPHQLADEILKTYANQIEFLDNLGGSGAFRFQCYRQAKVLAVGSGPFFLSLVAALLESGKARFHVLVTASVPTNRQRLAELVEHARQSDPEVAVEEVQIEGTTEWRELVKRYDSVLCVSQDGDVEELRAIHAGCREAKKMFLPAIVLQQAGIAGPLVHPDAEGCWESALRRIHKTSLRKDPRLHTFTPTAGAMLANVIVFELLKAVSEVSGSDWKNNLFLLDLETLEGNWHPFMPHPLVTGRMAVSSIEDLDQRLERDSDKRELNELLPFFSMLTSAETGILHIWDEGELKQLPLSQCRVQAADPLSDGPADLLPEIICSGMTHDEARREAGLAGVEAYVSRLIERSALFHELEKADRDTVGVGVGGSVAEGVCRGLQKCLLAELGKQLRVVQTPSVQPVHIYEVEDESCRYYLQAVTTMYGTPTFGLGADVHGFPVLWAGTGGHWFGSAGLNVTIALRNVLQQSLLAAQNKEASNSTLAVEVSSVLLDEKRPQNLVIPAMGVTATPEVLQSARQILKQNGKRLLVYDLSVEPMFETELAGVFGVLLREEGSR